MTGRGFRPSSGPIASACPIKTAHRRIVAQDRAHRRRQLRRDLDSCEAAADEDGRIARRAIGLERQAMQMCVELRRFVELIDAECVLRQERAFGLERRLPAAKISRS
jgi:hypothetical protein